MLLQIPALLAILLSTASVSLAQEGAKYGQGCSFPLENEHFACEDGLLGDRLLVYRNYYDGCSEVFGEEACQQEETRRLRDNAQKARSMINYTETGFQKTRVPPEVWRLLQEHWEAHKYHNLTAEWYRVGKLPRNNYWDAPSYVTNFLLDGFDLMKQTLPLMKQVMEDWTGVEQRATNLYGIRVYQNGTIMTPHVDRYPLVISVIINVDQDVDEPWPLEVIARNGSAVNITMEPGDMIMYEGHSTIHGRPFELKGNFYANAFVSFEPTGRKIDKDGSYYGTVYPQDGLPPFLLPNSPEEALWRQEHPEGWKYNNPLGTEDVKSSTSEAHFAASVGNVAKLRQIAQTDPDLLHLPDLNGWRPFHEAVYGGQQKAIEFLVQQGTDVNALTNSGHTALNLIDQHPVGQFHPFVDFLEQNGAVRME